MSLVNSNIFGISLLNCGLSSFELIAISDIRVITTVLTENVPQLLVQLLYAFAIGDVTQNTQIAFATSIMSIAASILNCCCFCMSNKEGQVYDIYYYFELKLKTKGICFTKDEKTYIKKRKGIKAALANKIVNTYCD
eukprot:372253_1